MNKFKIPGFFLCVYHNSFAQGLYNFHFSWSNNNIIHSQEHSKVKKQKKKLGFTPIKNTGLVLNFSQRLKLFSL